MNAIKIYYTLNLKFSWNEKDSCQMFNNLRQKIVIYIIYRYDIAYEQVEFVASKKEVYLWPSKTCTKKKKRIYVGMTALHNTNQW